MQLLSIITNGGSLIGNTLSGVETVLVSSEFTDGGTPTITIGGKGVLNWAIVFSDADYPGGVVFRDATTSKNYMEINLTQDK